MKRPNVLACGLREFFNEHLPQLRGMSPHTLHSYRDSLSLLLRFVASAKKCPVVALDIKEMTSDQIISFLKYLEEKRKNTSSTRNVRLAAIHAFFRFLAGEISRSA